MSLLDLPTTRTDADPLVVPGLLTALGLVPRRTPTRTTPHLIDAILSGQADIPADLGADQ
ncbi:hypothetical protein [Streptomyces sp. SID8352]|uniref:hypothetical protein n=1 Tax=Streptomyces sp. SID8352 TaxID=2690338 RepID=UPI0013703654|nr:hypothetical protein [Streptomyces sp. SID8352]MYU20762.1 hypothetical protein [Streptomyces sp. SID8352]